MDKKKKESVSHLWGGFVTGDTEATRLVRVTLSSAGCDRLQRMCPMNSVSREVET